MRFAYKVWHSEDDKWTAKKEAGRALEDDEITHAHQRLEEMVQINYDLEPAVNASVLMLTPPIRGVIIVLDADISEDEADRSIASCLVRINSIDPDLCFIAEPLPRTREAARPSVLSQLDMLSTESSEL
ncbi:hypothetical protein ACFPOE_19195 [Caenimonas terrae]|uniref:DUF1902 domain-containing protein n=1 Tax=Caenimonas terrae TaxID=696074 RepID=A0ABW0NHZ7_9BURK